MALGQIDWYYVLLAKGAEKKLTQMQNENANPQDMQDLQSYMKAVAELRDTDQRSFVVAMMDVMFSSGLANFYNTKGDAIERNPCGITRIEHTKAFQEAPFEPVVSRFYTIYTLPLLRDKVAKPWFFDSPAVPCN